MKIHESWTAPIHEQCSLLLQYLSLPPLFS